jgi:nitroreductase
MAAPSARNAQPWQIMAVTDRAALDSIGARLPYCKMIEQTNAAIVVCGDMTLALGGDAKTYWIQDCSAVTQNILLAAESMGLGAVWTGVYPITDRVKTVSDILNLPSYITPLCVIPIGYPTGEDLPKDKWKEERYHINKW